MRRFRGIRQIGQKCKVNIGVVIAQKPDFQIVNQARDLFFIQKQRGNGNQREVLRRNAAGKIEFWQEPSPQHCRGQIIHQLHRALRAGQEQ